MIMYDLVKNVWCGSAVCFKVGAVTFSTNNVNSAFQFMQSYNNSSCGCRVEVSERKSKENVT